MPIMLNVPEWGEVSAYSLREVARRLNVYVEDVQFWLDCELLQYYTMNETSGSGKVRKRVQYIDAEDLADAEKLHDRLDGPMDRALWYRYELRELQKKHGMPDPRSTQRTMVQPARGQQPSSSSQRQQPVPSAKPPVQPARRYAQRPALPPALQDVDEYAYADAPTVREDEYNDDYAEFEEEEEEEIIERRPQRGRPAPPPMNHYPRQAPQRSVQQPVPPVQPKKQVKQLPKPRKQLFPPIPDWRSNR